jgi:hypothetical protein
VDFVVTLDAPRIVVAAVDATSVYLTASLCFAGSTPVLSNVDALAFVDAGPQNYPVNVAMNGQQFTQDSVLFWYYKHPTLVSIFPAVGSVGGSLAVTITGTDFVSKSTTSYIRLRTLGYVASGDFVSSTTLLASSPTVPFGTTWVVMQVSLNAQHFSPSFLNFRYYDPPTLLTLNPVSGPASGNTSVTLVGMFETYSGLVDVLFGSELVNCAYTLTGSHVQCFSPAQVGSGNLNVTATVDSLAHTVRSFSVQPLPFQIYPDPRIVRLEPWLGPVVRMLSQLSVVCSWLCVVWVLLHRVLWRCGAYMCASGSL